VLGDGWSGAQRQAAWGSGEEVSLLLWVLLVLCYLRKC
jgi:cytochrome c biogenesis factor